jgi:hypothetical protein
MKVPGQSFKIVSQLLKNDFWHIKFSRMKNNLPVQLTLSLLFICVQAIAQTPEISTDRPDQSNTPLLIPKGALQIETGFIVEKQKTLLFTQRNFTYNNTLLRFGINDHFEVRLNTLYQGVSASSDMTPSNGFGPVSVGLKIKLADERGLWPQTSILSHINLRSGTTQFKPSHTSNDITLACSHELNERLSLTYNFGVKWDGESPVATTLYALSFAFDITDKLAAFVESYAFLPEERKSDQRIDAGITYNINPLLQWDLSGGLGVSENAPDNFLSTGLSIRLFN